MSYFLYLILLVIFVEIIFLDKELNKNLIIILFMILNATYAIQAESAQDVHQEKQAIKIATNNKLSSLLVQLNE